MSDPKAPTDEEIIAAVLVAPSTSQAADALGVQSEIIERWLSNPGMAKALDKTRASLAEGLLAQIQLCAGKVIEGYSYMANEAPDLMRQLKAVGECVDRADVEEVDRGRVDALVKALEAARRAGELMIKTAVRPAEVAPSVVVTQTQTVATAVVHGESFAERYGLSDEDGEEIGRILAESMGGKGE